MYLLRVENKDRVLGVYATTEVVEVNPSSYIVLKYRYEKEGRPGVRPEDTKENEVCCSGAYTATFWVYTNFKRKNSG